MTNTVCAAGVLLCLVSVSLDAAPKKVQVIYHTDPEGATLSEEASGTVFGTTPVVVEYLTNEAFRKGAACMPVRLVRVRWASGATTTQQLSLCPAAGKMQQITISRPIGDGREIDVQAAALAQQVAYLASLAQSAEAQASAARTQQTLQIMNSSILLYRPRVLCTSIPDAVGIAVFTTCR